MLQAVMRKTKNVKGLVLIELLAAIIPVIISAIVVPSIVDLIDNPKQNVHAMRTPIQ